MSSIHKPLRRSKWRPPTPWWKRSPKGRDEKPPAPGEDETQLFTPGADEASTRKERLQRLEQERGVFSQVGKKAR